MKSSWVDGVLSAPCGCLGRARPSGLAGTCGPSTALRPAVPTPDPSVIFLTIFPEAESPAPMAVGPRQASRCEEEARVTGVSLAAVLPHPTHFPELSRSRTVGMGFPPPAAAKTLLSGGSVFDGKYFPDSGSFHVDFITSSEVVRGAWVDGLGGVVTAHQAAPGRWDCVFTSPARPAARCRRRPGSVWVSPGWCLCQTDVTTR